MINKNNSFIAEQKKKTATTSSDFHPAVKFPKMHVKTKENLENLLLDKSTNVKFKCFTWNFTHEHIPKKSMRKCQKCLRFLCENCDETLMYKYQDCAKW